MKCKRILCAMLAVLLLAACFSGCAPKLDKDIAAVAKDYYSFCVLRQDLLTANESCAYDRVAAVEEIYSNWAEKEDMTLQEYLKYMAEKRDLDADIETVEDYLKAQSEKYIAQLKESLKGESLDKEPKIASFYDADIVKINEVYNSVLSRYQSEGVDFSKYFDVNDIEEAKSVSVGIDGNNAEVLIVKIGDSWFYLA